MTICFRAVSHALPTRAVSNEMVVAAVLEESCREFEGDLAVLEQQLRAMFELAGTRNRYHRAEHETALDLGVLAGQRALAEANMRPQDVDLMLYVGVGRGFLEPATFNVFQDALGLENATGFDILDACASWMRALHVAWSLINSGVHRNVMLLNAEFNVGEYQRLRMKSAAELEYTFPALTIGEAATAVILSSAGERADDVGYAANFRSIGGAHDLCKIPLPNIAQYSRAERRDDFPSLKFYSFGERLFQFGFMQAVKHFRSLPDFVASRSGVDTCFFHSASQTVSERMQKVLELRDGHHTHNLFGNTVSASIPLGMSHAIAEGKLKRGMNVLLGCGSAGFSSAWCKFRYV